MTGRFSLLSLLAAAAWRGWRARPFLALLNVLGMAIGVAVYLAIRMVNHSATRAFEAGIDIVAGRSSLVVTAPGGVEERGLAEIRATPGVEAATPVVEGLATLPDQPGEYLRIMGLDPFTAAPFVAPEDGGARAAWGNGTEDWLARGNALTISSTWAERLGLAPGATLPLLTSGRPVTVDVAGVYARESGSSLPERTAFLDIGWAQELLAMPGRLSSVQILAAPGTETTALAAALTVRLPAGTQVQPPAQRNRQVSLMLQGFQLNLTALSMVSLLVGVFLTGNTVAASVVRQRREIGVLRAIGASRTQVRALFLGEAAVSALLGAALGIPLARLLAGGLLSGVSETISAHYVLLSIDRVWWSGTHALQAAACGLLAALGGAWLPAREASALDPVAVLRPGRTIEPRAPRLVVSMVSAAVLLGLGALLSVQALRTGPPWLSFAACLATVLGFVMLARPVARVAAVLTERLTARMPRLVLVRMGAAHLSRSLHRGVPVIAALLTSVAMVLGVTIMVFSFRGTLAVWVDSSLRADIYLSPAANETVRQATVVPAGLADWLRARPEVAAVETLHEDEAILTDSTHYALRAVERPADLPFTWQDAPAGAYAAWFQPDHIVLTEVLAGRGHWKPGDRISLTTPQGVRAFTVAGISYDYSDDKGCFYITRENYNRYWNGRGEHAIAVYLRDPSTGPVLETAIRENFRDDAPLAIYLNAALRERVFGIFDQTFAVTGLLRIIAVAVAVLGILLALSTLVAERAWDIAALRAVGASRGQVAAIHLAEAGLTGLISALLGTACGIALAMILTWVVNKAFFGWTVRFAIPWGEVALTPLWVTAVALLAGLLPAWRAASTPLAASLRSE